MIKYIKNNFIFLIIVLQPILDVIAYFCMDTIFSSVAFLIRSLVLSISTIYVLLKMKSKVYIVYMFIIAAFATAHFANTYFTTNINLIEDIKEFIRVFYMPIMAVNIYYLLKDKNNAVNQVKYGIICNVLIIFAIIILGLLTNSTVNTYAEGIGLRGWFYNSNSQSIILCLCVPVMLFYAMRTKKLVVEILATIIGFFLLYSNGTTGCYLMIIPSFLLMMYNSIINTKTKAIKIFEICLFLIPIVSSIVFYKYSPDYKITELANSSYEKTEQYFQEQNAGQEENPVIPPQEPTIPTEPTEPLLTNEEKIIKKYFSENFIKDYGYETIEQAIGNNLDYQHIVNNRYRKKLVASVVFDNSNLSTKLLGIEFTKIDNYDADMENDYSAIFYYYGYIGLAVYLILIAYIAFILIKTFIKNPIKRIIDTQFILLGSMFIMLNLFAELSGSLLKRPNASIYLSLIIVMILLIYKGEKNVEKECK